MQMDQLLLRYVGRGIETAKILLLIAGIAVIVLSLFTIAVAAMTDRQKVEGFAAKKYILIGSIGVFAGICVTVMWFFL